MKESYTNRYCNGFVSLLDVSKQMEVCESISDRQELPAVFESQGGRVTQMVAKFTTNLKSLAEPQIVLHTNYAVVRIMDLLL